MNLSTAFEPTKDTAAHILDAAYTLFLEFGLRKTTMEDVAKRANIGRITVYRHYADKPTLFQAVVMRECFRSMQEVERLLAQIHDVEERFVSGFVIVVNGARKHPLISRLLETEPEWLLPYLTTKGEAMLRFGSQYVASTLRQEQYVTTPQVDLLAEMLWRLLHSILLTPGGLMAPPNDDEALRHVARSFLLPLVIGNSR
jgi:AcrR family transcriptional regulator